MIMISKGLRGVAGAVFAITIIALLQTFSYAGTQGKAEVNGVKPGEVCMVNDTVMDKPQIPVKVDGKTYYGCCEGCVERLKKDGSLRTAKDPVTGREVDKAKAFIIKAANGTALYFESDGSAAKYTANGLR